MSKKEYIFGSQDIELNRLGFQHRVWLQETIDLWKRAGISIGMKIFDIGCGPGFTTIDLAHLVGQNGSVVGLDKSKKFTDYLNSSVKVNKLSNIQVINESIHDFDTNEKDFDIIYLRWVLSWVDDVEEIIIKLSKYLRPGGKIVLQEYYNWHTLKLHPQNSKFNVIRQGAFESWFQTEGEVNIGQELPKLLSKHKYDILSLKPLSRIGRPGDMVWQWIMGFLKIYSEILIEMNLLTKNDLEEFKKELTNIESDQSSFLFAPQMIEIIATKK